MTVSAFVAGSGDSRADEVLVSRPAAALAAPDSEAALRPDVNCTCRYRGADFSIGDSVCIRGALATCSTFLNNTSWAITKTPCPMARLDTGAIHPQ